MMLEHELKINPEFEEIIPPISPYEFTQLEDNIVAEGELLMPIIIWKAKCQPARIIYLISGREPLMTVRHRWYSATFQLHGEMGLSMYMTIFVIS